MCIFLEMISHPKMKLAMSYFGYPAKGGKSYAAWHTEHGNMPSSPSDRRCPPPKAARTIFLCPLPTMKVEGSKKKKRKTVLLKMVFLFLFLPVFVFRVSETGRGMWWPLPIMGAKRERGKKSNKQIPAYNQMTKEGNENWLSIARKCTRIPPNWFKNHYSKKISCTNSACLFGSEVRTQYIRKSNQRKGWSTWYAIVIVATFCFLMFCVRWFFGSVMVLKHFEWLRIV